MHSRWMDLIVQDTYVNVMSAYGSLSKKEKKKKEDFLTNLKQSAQFRFFPNEADGIY